MAAEITVFEDKRTEQPVIDYRTIRVDWGHHHLYRLELLCGHVVHRAEYRDKWRCQKCPKI